MKLQIGTYKVDVVIVVAVLVIVLAGVAWLAFSMGQRTESQVITQQEQEEPQSTVEEVSPDTEVPEPGDGTLPENIARPTQVRKTASPTAQNRDFLVEIIDGSFVPDTVIIHQGDASWITFKAVDAAYDVYQPDKGLSIELEEGQSKVMAAQFSDPGKYMMYCRSCGGPEEGPVGYITVVPKD